jgi:two-component system chemotaxis response regulator CheY
MPKTILVIDDSDSARAVIGSTLKEAGYTVVEACDGKDGLSKLNGEKIHLIVCDVNMPEMDGIRFVEEAKKLPAYQFTPIIMLTAVSQESKKREGQSVGAKAWVVKPFQPAQLLTAISKLIAR